MFIDRGAAFSWDQAITGDTASTDSLDLGVSPIDRGPGESLVVAIHIPQSFNNLTSLAIQIQCDNDIAFGSPRTLTAMTLALAELTAGRRFTIGLPGERIERYMRLNYDVTGTNPSTGRVTAWLTSADMLDAQLGDA